jgi:hypothetical protein
MTPTGAIGIAAARRDSAARLDDREAEVMAERGVVRDRSGGRAVGTLRARGLCQELVDLAVFAADIEVVPPLDRGTEGVADRPADQAAVHAVCECRGHQLGA